MADQTEALIQGRLNLPEEPSSISAAVDRPEVAEPVAPFKPQSRTPRSVSEAAEVYRANDAVARQRKVGERTVDRRVRMPADIRAEILKVLQRNK